jgi:hypothetical protein
MSATAQDTNLLVFGEFLADLRRQGFQIGVGHYLRLQELLNKAGPETTPEDLKTLLCPLFATNQVEQEHFYRAFDSFFTLFQLSPPESTGPKAADETVLFRTLSPSNSSTARRKHLYKLGLAALIIIAAIVAGMFLSRQQTDQITKSVPLQENSSEKVPPEVTQSPTPDLSETKSEPSFYKDLLEYLRALRYFIGLPMFFIMIIAPLVVFLFYDQPPQSRRAGSKFRSYLNGIILWLVVITYILRWYTYLYASPYLDRILDSSPVDLIEVAVLAFLLFLFFYRQLPHVSQNKHAIYERLRPIILSLSVLASAAGFLFQIKQDWIALFAPFLFLLIYEWHRWQRRKLILQKLRGKKPPSVWPVHVEAFAPKLYDQDMFYIVAREMRRWQAGEHEELDVEATIHDTVASLGYPNFRYRLSSRSPEYLILIDRAGFRDHQAQFFNELTKALEREGIYMARYFFDGDPRVCCEESGGRCYPLAELYSRFAGHRLLIFGDGEMLLDPVTGEVATWASIFVEWQDRALFTPRTPAQWDLREIYLAGLFPILPATIEGLLTLFTHFGSLTVRDVRSGRQGDTELIPPKSIESDSPNLVKELRAYLGEQVFQWLSTCAVYPELHWDLTLYLGSLPTMDSDLIREANLLSLIRLPWFRRGSIPDNVRWLLISELAQDKERAAREAIIKLLEKNPPPAETHAADTYQLNLVIQRWLSRRDRRWQREALETLDATPLNRVARDYTVIRFLETLPSSALGLLLPLRLRRIFYRNGIPAFGLKVGARLLCAIAVAIVGVATQRLTSAPATETSTRAEAHASSPILVVRTSTGRFVWVDEEAVVLGPLSPRDRMPPFFVRGLDESNTEQAQQMNRERVRVAIEIIRDWEAAGLSERVSEVNLDDLRDVRAQLAGNDAQIEIRLGGENFGPRLKRALEELDARRATPIGPLIMYIDASQLGAQDGKGHLIVGSSLDALPSISGKVIDSNDKPIQGAKITIDEIPNLQPAKTSSSGSFTLKEIPKNYGDIVRLRVIKEDYQPNPYTEDFVLGKAPLTIRLRRVN